MIKTRFIFMTFIINTFVICLAKLIKEIFLSRPWLIKSNKFIAVN